MFPYSAAQGNTALPAVGLQLVLSEGKVMTTERKELCMLLHSP